jgi:hypothetical protein
MVGFVKAFVCAWEHKRQQEGCHEMNKKSKGCGDMVNRGSVVVE